MLISGPGYTLTWTWNRDGEQEKVGFPKESQVTFRRSTGKNHGCLPNAHSPKPRGRGIVILFLLPKRGRWFLGALMTWIQVQILPFSFSSVLPHPHTNTDALLLKLGAKRKDHAVRQGTWIPLTSQNPGRLPGVPKTLLSWEREQGTERVIILRDSGELMEKERPPSDGFMQLIPRLTSLYVL